MEQLVNQITQVVAPYLPRLASALGILIVGWIIAAIAGALIRGALRRTTLDNRLASWFAGQEAAKKINVEVWVGRAVYCLVMLFVLVAVFQTLGLTMLTEPLRGMLTQIFEFGPRLLGAVLLLFVAWALGSAARLIVTRALGATKFDQRLADETGEDEEAPTPMSKSIGDALYWFVFLLFLPGVLDALGLEGMLDPVKEMVSQITGFLPNLLTAGITLAVGWFLARIVQRIVTSLLAAVGLDALSQRVGLAGALGDQKLSRVLGMVVYVLIFIPILIGALSALQLDSVTEPLSRMLTMILESIPAVFAAMLVLTISYMVGRVVAGLVTSLLGGIGFNAILERLGIGRESAEGDAKTPSSIVGSLVLIAIMLFAATEAAGLLGFTALTDIVSEFLGFAGHIVVGLFILGIGLFLANLAASTVRAGGSAHASFLATTARIAIVVLAAAMGLRQMGLANEIISLAFGLTLGAVAVAVAIAFGLGGREIAARQLDSWGQSFREEESPKSIPPGGQP